ncbi:MAG: substrate-binding domain-containing protein [Anaerolineales bacterium]|nr:substrate-binding domain-containing protein [Anaerolineales bacterium]
MEFYKRRQAILSLLEELGEVSVEELAAHLQVSANTIRNDLNTLEAEHLLRRIRGGAVGLDKNGAYANKDFAPASVNQTAKEQMGRWAASMVKDGEAIVLDASSTIYHVAAFLKDRRDLAVVTNGLEVALLLARNPTNKVILAANVVRSDGFSMIGSLHPDLQNHFYASKCFITCSGLSPEQGLTEADLDEAPLKSQMIKLARQVIVLADHSKMGRIDTYRFAEPDQIDHLITDEAAAPDMLAALQAAALFPITVVGAAGVKTLEPGAAGKKRRYRIGFGNMTEKMMFAQQVRRSLERVSQPLENVELLIRDNNLDPQTALENADWFVANKVDLVIEYQIDAKAGNIIMDKFNQANIPVIAVDIPLPGATFYGADNYRAGHIAGEALGQWVKKNWQGQLDVLLKVELARVGPVAGARLQGQQEGLEAIIGPIAEERILSLDATVIVDEVEQAMTRLLPAISPTARIAIIAINDDAAVGALTAFEEAGRLEQVVAVGQNADRVGRQALRRPDFPFIGTTRYAPEKYGEQLLNLALKILAGKPVPPAVYNQHVFLTRDNINEYYPDLVDVTTTGGEAVKTSV